MQKPRTANSQETTEAMLRNIGLELAEIEQTIGRCKGDAGAEPRLTGTRIAHLPISSEEHLQGQQKGPGPMQGRAPHQHCPIHLGARKG